MNTDPQPVSPPQREPVILIIDDDPNNLAIVSSYLEDCSYTLLAAEDGESGVKRALYARPDLILVDIMMPGIDGYETCRRLKAQEETSDIPVIFMTALAETEHKVRGFAVGAVDYVTKPFHREEVRARVGVHLRLRELTSTLQDANASLERRVAQRTMELDQVNRELQAEMLERGLIAEELRQSEQKFRAIFDHSFEFIGLMAKDGTLLKANRSSLEFCGANEDEVINRFFWETPWWQHAPEQREKLRQAVAVAANGEFVRFETTNQAADGSIHYVDFSLKPLLDDAGNVILLIPEGRDITEQKKLAEQLRQSQKMEAVGTLTGGIAHDFNNILTAITGYGSILQMELGKESPLVDLADNILAAANRAARLIRSLLSFSRKQVITSRPESVNRIVTGMEKLLQRIIGEDIDFRTLLTAEEMIIKADSSQIEQVLMNMAANSRDAMPDGGVLTITTERLVIEDEAAFLKRGTYALISVSDTGLGFGEQIKQKMFEPFFTTKEPGKGTGLGLSMVYSIVKQHDGEITVYSEPGKGTTFKIFLPLINAAYENLQDLERGPITGGSETILIAEDDVDVRVFMSQTLREHGYTVIEAEDGEDAVQKFRKRQQEIQLLIFDVIMPKKNGKEAYEEIKQEDRSMRILFTSGYTADIISKKGMLDEGIIFVSKPLTPHLLHAKVREALMHEIGGAM